MGLYMADPLRVRDYILILQAIYTALTLISIVFCYYTDIS